MREPTPWDRVFDLVSAATGDTIFMVGIATVLAAIGGIPLGVLLHITSPTGLSPRPVLHRVLGVVVDIGRSLPFVVLLVLLGSVTRTLVGTTIGPTAVIVPLTVGAIPFVGRLVQAALREVNAAVVEAAITTGASRTRMVRSVLLREAGPALVAAIGVTAVTLIGYSAMAGVIGGGGLGDVAIRYGYQRNDTRMLWASVIALGALAWFTQLLFDRLARGIDRRRSALKI
ncbi:methionine ABC transporter permease [Actinoalloteichus hymeniacidonis]|uniref:ABC-type metal ion transport system, permease component n=1 Tax=Actinoalloteichus hymeniacidonis TaxID=340345 RepID=A0AAC9MVW5_9PSEU|nr:methionine ABC transporter permease [Actinoalloteichus hymeniacidonis]AOS61558.1 ABC-type metal ion transport system, permease component [Actinoalloteichus hymeniacidonis]MBB5910433.1 D-methionine transport system permease protein [Actinoalloteichus hymeniacidonis]